MNDLLYPADRLAGHAVLEWGRTHEALARADFTSLTGMQVVAKVNRHWIGIRKC